MKQILLIIITVLLSGILTFGQSTNGKIVGTVSTIDGVIPGAKITITDNKTGKVKNAVTNEDGTFVISQIEFGSYSVKINADGFKTFIATDVKIDVGQEYPLNVKLEVGQITEEVSITAGAEQINASNAELSTTVSEQQIRDLPLNGRNPLSLVSLQAGANVTTNSINGQRSSSTNVTRDGLNVQDNYIRTNTFVQDRPTVDDTGEFTITTQNAGAELGAGSSQIRMVTPRGGKDFHGALYAFNRNSLFTANSFFNNERGTLKPFLNRNEFGGSISGPLPIPNFGEGGPMLLKDKAFFFFNYEGFRLAQQVTASGTTLLPQARNGDFTYTDTATNTLRTVNILTGAGLDLGTALNQNTFNAAGGVLGVDPVIQSRILSNLPNTGNGLATGVNYTQVYSFLRFNPQTRNSNTSRFDLNINDRSALNFVYRRSNNLVTRTESDYPSGFSTTPYVTTGGPVNFFVGAWQFTPTNSFSNEFRAGLQYADVIFKGSNVPSNFIIGSLSIITNPEGTYRDQGRYTKYHNFQDNAVYTRGNHSFRFGGQRESYEFNAFNDFGTIPTYSISSTTNPNTPSLQAALFPGTISTTELGRANSLRYLLGGIIGRGTQTANLISPEAGYGFGSENKFVNYEIYSAYATDQWRVRPNFTLNIGARYEFYTPVNAPNPLFLEPVIKNNDLVASLNDPNGSLNYVGGNAGKKGNFTKPDWDNFGGNISFAYSTNYENKLLSSLVGNGTVLRGGFRLGYVNDEYSKAVNGLSAFNAGLGSVDTLAVSSTGSTNLKSALTPRNGFEGLPALSRLPTFNAPPRSFVVNNAQFNSTIYGTDPRLQVPRVFEYNIGVQRNIGFKSVLEVRYVGSFSNQLVRTIDYNQIDIYNNGFLEDFLKAQNNCRLQGAVIAPTAANPLFACTDARYNPAIPGSVPLNVLTKLHPTQAIFSFNPNGSVNSTGQTNVAFIQQGRIGSIANNALLANQQGSVIFHPQPNSFATQILTNQGKYRYNSLQAEVRRRFDAGLYFQINYTFQKILADIVSDGNDDQNRLAALQNNNDPGLNYGRPDYDRTHTVNISAIYELPFGRGKAFLNEGGWKDRIFGGIQFSSIVQISSGPPLGIIDPRATAAITTRSTRQSAKTSLSRDDLKKLTGIYKTPNGIYFIDPKVLFAVATPAAGSGLPVLNGIDLYQPLPAGYTLTSVRAANPINQAPFPGQVFFFNNAGETGNIPRNFLNGLTYANWTAGLTKKIRIGETRILQLRMEAFNVLNRQVPYFGSDLDINSNTFGRITSSYNTPRIMQFGARFDF